MNQYNNRAKVTNAFIVFTVMLILYFIVGLFTVINQQFQIPLQTAMLPHDGNITNALVTMLNFSWFLAYPLSEGFATRWLEKYGYRKTSFLALLILVTGLAIYEAAVLFHIYTPVRISILGNQISLGFFIFLIGSFVIGMAATVLQVVLNLYLAVCQIGKTTALQRQMIGGTSNSIGMAVAPLVISYLIFYGTPLHDIRTEQFVVPLVILILLMLVVTFFVSRTQMPSIDTIRQTPGETLEKSVWSFRHLKLGVWGIFFYVGIEVAVGANVQYVCVRTGRNVCLQCHAHGSYILGIAPTGTLFRLFYQKGTF